MQYVTDSLYVPPLISSAPLSWRGVRVEQYHLEAGRLAAQQHEHQPLGAAARVAETVYQTGDLRLFPGGEYGTTIAWTTLSDNIYLTLEAFHLRQFAGQDVTLTKAVLQKRMKFEDPFLSQLSRQLLIQACLGLRMAPYGSCNAWVNTVSCPAV